METLKSSFHHIASTLDATCIATRRQQPLASAASSSASSHSQPGALNTSLARILADHHRIRGSALRCFMTALDIDRLAIDKAYRHIALLHGTGQHREAGQAERAVRGYPPLLEVLHVVMEKNGVEEWDRWSRREENAERDEALRRYVPFPFTTAAASARAQPLPAPIAHLLPTLAERQMHDEPPPSSPDRRQTRSLSPPGPSPVRTDASEQGQPGDAALDGAQSPDDEVLLKRAIEADDRARAKRLAARREKERQQRLEAKKREAIRAAEEEHLEVSQEEDKAADKEEHTEAQHEVHRADKAQAITVDDETDAEVQQLASMDEDGAADSVRLDGGLPSDGAPPTRPQLLAGVSHSPSEADVSPINEIGDRVGGSYSPYSTSSPEHINGNSFHDSFAGTDDSAASSLPLSTSLSSSLPLPSRSDNLHPINHSSSSSSQPISRPVRARKKAPRYGEDDLYTPNEPRHKHRPSPTKPATKSTHSPTTADDRLWEIDAILCFRFRAYPPFHELAGTAYRSFLIRWKGYGAATWVMEEDLVSVDQRRLERLVEWDEWRERSANADVEVEEEEPWVSNGEDSLNNSHKKRRRGPVLGPRKKKKS